LGKVKREAKTSIERPLAQAGEPSAAAADTGYGTPNPGHNADQTLTDADLISEVIARGLFPVVAAQLSIPKPQGSAQLPTPQPLAISVKAARESLSVGNTTIWALIKSGDIGVIRPCRRTLVLVTSLHAYVARLAAIARHSSDAARLPIRLTEPKNGGAMEE
jgi:hypothetical protein